MLRWIQLLHEDTAELRAAQTGAAASPLETVSREFQALGLRGFRVLSCARRRDQLSQLDFVVVNPAGEVATITVKGCPGTPITVRGDTIKIYNRSEQFVRIARYQSHLVSEMLANTLNTPISVSPAIVFVTSRLASQVVIKQPPAGVTVLAHQDLARWFLNKPHHPNDERAGTVYKAINHLLNPILIPV